MNYEYKHRVNPFYIKAIHLAGLDPNHELTNEQAKAWVDTLYSKSGKHSVLRAFLKYKDFIEDLQSRVYEKANRYGYRYIEDESMIDAALDLLESGYGIQQILNDMELFFTAYKIRLKDQG